MEDRYRFTCGHCDVDFLVDEEMRAFLIDDGCPACADDVDDAMFAEAAPEAPEE